MFQKRRKKEGGGEGAREGSQMVPMLIYHALKVSISQCSFTHWKICSDLGVWNVAVQGFGGILVQQRMLFELD